METIDIQSMTVEAGQLVLDIGCGEGRHAIALSAYHPRAYSLGIDLDFGDLQRAERKHQAFFAAQSPPPPHIFSQANGLQLPLPTHSVDHIICSEVLEHVDNYRAMLDELHRVLKPQGTLCISVPRAWPERICWRFSSAYHNVPGGHVRIFSSKALKREIKAYDYQLTRQHFAHALHSPYWWLRCLFWHRGETFFLCRWYHKLLVWDLLKKPWLTQTLEKCLNPLLGKSLVLYFAKDEIAKPANKTHKKV